VAFQRAAGLTRCLPFADLAGKGYSRPSRAGQVADASGWLGEGLEPIRFDASPELRQRSPDQAEMDRTDNGRVDRRHLLEGTALQHDLLPALRSPDLGPETELLVETNDLVDRLHLPDRPKRWRLADAEYARP
jgi:hypothetical protein